MATAANLSSGAMPVEGSRELPDPFVSTPVHEPSRHRYSGLDVQYMSLYSNGSPAQAERALEAHMAETERRLQEASRLGTVLLKQKKELAERLGEVKAQEQEDEVAPELRQKLQELEREVNDVSRETARAFLGKSRIPSGESSDLSVLSSEAQHSPSKIHPPSSRKQRNQPQGRMNDIKLATEISTSLIGQIRDLQAAYAEKDDALKMASKEKSQLELDVQGLRQKIRALDESEQRFKDENWSLETRLRELDAAQEQAADREQRLTQHLNAAKSEKATVLREFEDLKQTHGKLAEDHVAARKQHEVEILSLKRDVSANETERIDLQRKVDELTSQNKELAKAVHYRLRSGEFSAPIEKLSDEEELAEGRVTPDNSPPGSPSKATPRHGALESETLKSSLHHAHRMIQNLKNNIHREKTEKIELKRLLQEARDELESRRGQGAVDSGKKRKTNKDQDIFKKPTRLDRLGAARSSREDIILDDPDWEEHDEIETPSRRRTAGPTVSEAVPGANEISSSNNVTDAYITATENSDAFETAHEQESTTETDAFHTGVETLDGDSTDDLTETESGPARRSRLQKKPSPTNRYSFQSTASTSGDEFDLTPADAKTPVQGPKYKLRVSRGGIRKSPTRANDEDLLNSSPAFRDSPASVTSTASAASSAAGGKSLFAELGNLSDAETDEGSTPKSTTMFSPMSSPELPKKSPAPSALRNSESVDARPEMVNASTMTEPQEEEAVLSTIGTAIAGGIGLGLTSESGIHGNADERRKSTTADSEPVTAVEAGPEFPSRANDLVNDTPPLPDIKESPGKLSSPGFALSPIVVQQTAPMKGIQSNQSIVDAVASVTAPLAFSPLISQHTEPEASKVPEKVSEPEHVIPTVRLSYAPIMHQETEPVELPRPSTAKRISQLEEVQTSTPAKSSGGFFGNVFKRNRSSKDVSTIVAEDSTAQPLPTASDQQKELTPPRKDARKPFQPIEANALPPTTDELQKSKPASPKKRPYDSTTEGTQTLLSAEELDRLMRPKAIMTSTGTDTKPAVISPTKSTFGSVSPRRGKEPLTDTKSRRPGSQGSLRSRGSTPPPPLPMEAKQVIAAAAQRAPGTTPAAPGSMGPPLMPASAYNRNSQVYRPRTPVRDSMTSPTKGASTVRPSNSYQPSRSGAASPATTRRSSVSSFASELDHRFNISRSAVDAQGFDINSADPRMIQAITQTMIGEFLWKYTRKAGREEMSSTRHRRFFWVHPYTRMLYWSEQDPSTAGRAQLKAKSVAIEAVRVVSDDNPMPPGLHRKSLVVITPGRSIKFTASTSQRHETWFNALSYLLLRTSAERDDEANGEMTAEDVEEFNPGWRSSSRMTGRSRASLSSHASRTTVRTASPVKMQYPTLVQRQLVATQKATVQQRSQSAAPTPQGSISKRLSSIGSALRTSSTVRGSFSSKIGMQKGQMAEVTDPANGAAHDSAEELRAIIAAQERDADRLENVRACCDGKVLPTIMRIRS